MMFPARIYFRQGCLLHGLAGEELPLAAPFLRRALSDAQDVQHG